MAPRSSEDQFYSLKTSTINALGNMGFWDGIIDSVAAGVGFITEHAGDIANAANTIANIIPPLVSDKDVTTEASDVSNLKAAMDANEQRMRDAALHLQNQKKTSLRPAVNNADDSHTENSEFDYTGIIPNITADAMGQAPDVIGSDLNMLLSINGFKTTMFVDTDKPVDVGKELASKMVSKADPVPRDAAGNASLLATAPLSCGPDADGSIVTGQCVYYKVPLAGSAIENSAWHAHVRLETSMPLKALEVLQERKTRLSLPLKPRRTASGIQSPVNATTVSAIYNTSDDMGDFISAAVKTIDPKFKPVDIIELGRKWVYQFYTDPSIGPAAVMDAFQAALSAEMQTMPSSKVVGNPIIKIESQTTVLA